jgi:hypothetical protein
MYRNNVVRPIAMPRARFAFQLDPQHVSPTILSFSASPEGRGSRVDTGRLWTASLCDNVNERRNTLEQFAFQVK